MRTARATSLAVAVALCVAAPARADGPVPLRYDLRVDVPVTAGALALWAGSELAKGTLAPASCRFCEPNALDAWTRQRLVWGYDARARTASDLLAFGALPVGYAAHQLLAARAAGDTKAGLYDLLFVAEAVAIAQNVNQLVKFAVARERPFVHYGNYPDPGRRHDPDDDVSFYSGHTSTAFALAAAAGTVSTLRGYRSAPWVWTVGMTLAAGVGYLRIAGDKHYLTDVLVGAAAGTAIGIAVPRLLHGREEPSREPGASAPAGTAVVPLPLGVLVVF